MKTAFKLFVILATMLIATSPAMAEGARSSTPEVEMNLYELIKTRGGVVMYPLAIISVFTVVLVFFYFLTIRRNRVVSDRFMNNAEILIRKNDYLGLVAQCNNSNESMARITERAVDFMTGNEGISFNEVREVAEAEGSRQSGMLNNRISYLSDIGSIATMLGLLGTVFGMIKAFLSIAQGNVDGVQQMKVAEGIYPALLTTGVGLSIGIVALIFYSFFRGRVQKYISELEAAATHLMALLSAQHKRAARQHTDTRSGRNDTQTRPYFEAEEGANPLSDDFAIPEEQGRKRVYGQNDLLEHEGYQGATPASVKSRTVEGI